MAADDVVWADELLWDHLILDSDDNPVGMVDDLELTDPGDGRGPILTALLSGPTAFGPRLGGRIGVWWTSVGRRLRAGDDPYPPRVPTSLIEQMDGTGIHLGVSRDELPTGALGAWVHEKIVGRIPGNGS
jgi:hypothetical protein